MQVDTQHPQNRYFKRFLLKWKNYLEEVDFIRDFPTFVIEDNDILRGGGEDCDIPGLEDLMLDNTIKKD